MDDYDLELTHQKWQQINQLLLAMSHHNELDMIRKTVLENLQTIIPHKKSFFDIGYFQDRHTVFFNPFSINMTSQEQSAYYKYYQDSDYMAWMLPNREAVFYRDSQIITDEAKRKTEIYKSWMKPMEVHYSAGCTLIQNGILYGSITLFKGQEEDFTNEDLFILMIISEHITARLATLHPKGFKKNLSYNQDKTILAQHPTTIRENEIIHLICSGISNKDIGRQLFISENTVKKHISSIFTKYNVHTRTQLIQLFLKN